MTTGTLRTSERTTAIKEVLASNDVRTVIANHLGVSVDRIRDATHLSHDLGADWLDRLDLVTVIEDQFPGLEITDDELDRIEVVGDLTSGPQFVRAAFSSVGEAHETAKRLRGRGPLFLESRGRRDA